MENRLVSMVDFVLKLNNKNSGTYVNSEAHQLLFDMYSKIWKYANFLKQPLKLGMFVPCDENDVPLVEPKNMADSILDGDNGKEWAIKKIEYQQAKDRVLFEGFEYLEDEEGFYLEHDNVTLFPDEFGNYTIENLIQDNLTLTASAIKQLEL